MDTGNKAPSGLVLESGMIVASRYEIQERLGAGGMGMVYLAKDKDLDGETIALKLLLPHLALDETAFRRFRNEVLVARTLTHPNIVRTHDIGKTEVGYSYISMEYVDGISLKDKLFTTTAQAVLSFEEAIKILFQIINGISYAHGKGIIHRDLKPANVLIDSHGEVKLADFGTARFVNIDTALTQTGQMMGTPDYMSPEQIKGEELTPACDIYALGIMSYELVMGRKPFTADSAVALAFKHVNDPLPKFANPAKGIPKWFEDFVLKATAKKLEDRFSSMAEMSTILLKHYPTLGTGSQGTIFSLDVTSLQAAVGANNKQGRTDDFKLGTSGSSKTENDHWNFGDSSRPVVFFEEHAGNFSFLKWFLIFLLVLGVGHKLSLKTSGAYKQFVANNLPLLLKISGETQEPEKIENQTVKNEQEDRENYTKELDSFLENNSKEEKSDLNKKQDISAISSSTAMPTLVSTTVLSEETTVTTTSIKVITTLAIKEEPIVIPISQLSFSGYLMFREGEKTILDSHVSSKQLALLSWMAKLDIKGGAAKDLLPEIDQLKSVFSINVVDLNNSNTIATLSPLSAQLISRESRKLLVTGNLQEFAKKNPIAGNYRLDLIKSGELVLSSTLSIVGDFDSTKPEIPNNTVPNTLPLAKGHEERISSDSAVINPPLTPQEIPTPSVATETYRGVFNFTDKVGSIDEKRNFTLEIAVSNDKVTGKATIAGFEDFSVEGKVLARGMELELRNSSYGIRLTSGLRSDRIRGLYSFPAFQKKGNWEVSSAK